MLSVPLWCAFVADAMATCSNNPPATGQTVDCTGTGNTAVVAPTGVTGVTVNAPTGTSITGVAQTVSGSNAQYSSVFVNDGSTVNNGGTISPTLPTTSKQRDYVGVNLNGSNTTLVNTGAITVTNAATLPGSSTYRLYGVISSAPDGGPADFSNVSVKNLGSITISQSANAVARGVYAGENMASMSIDNFGSISVTRIGSAAGTSQFAGIDADDDTDSLTVHNHTSGTVSASGTNTFAVGGRATDYTLTNDGTITNTSGGRGAIVIYGGNGDDLVAGTATIVNSKTGVVNGNVLISDGNPLGVPLGNVGAPATATSGTRDSTFTNAGTVNGAFAYASGTHVLDNTGTITGPISVFQTAAVGIGGASFTLNNSGTLGGDVTITDRADSVNKIRLSGTGFSGNIVAVNGTGSNSLVLNDVTTLASVQKFTNLDLRQSNVAVQNGVSLVNNATLATTIYGQGGTVGAPSTKVGTIAGTLTLAGTTTITPTIKSVVRDGDVYQVASTVTGGPVSVQQTGSALVRTTADTSTGKLLLETSVRDPRSISGISQPAAATLQGLLSYGGTNPQVRALGALVENLGSDAAVRQAGTALSPIVDGADVQAPINSVMLFAQQLDSRLDSFIYGQIPSSGRSADLGVAKPVPVYGVLPTSGAWIEGIGGGVHQSTSNGIGGYNATLEGVIGGYDRLLLPNVRVGGAFGYVDSRVNGNANIATHENIQTFQGLGYAAYEAQNYYLRGSVGYGGVNFQSSRQISFANFSDIATGSHGGNIFTARGEGGVPFEYMTSLLIPYAAFTYSHLQQNAYTESSGNGAAFSYLAAGNNSERSEVGGKMIVPITGMPVFSYLFPGGSAVALEARAAYVHEFGNVTQTVAASFTGGGNLFVAAGPVPSRDMVDYGVGLRMGSGPVQIDLSYNGVARSTFLEQYGVLRARYVF